MISRMPLCDWPQRHERASPHAPSTALRAVPLPRYAVEERAELRRQEAERGFNERPEAAERFFREGRAGQ